jgi:hypothetical protein
MGDADDGYIKSRMSVVFQVLAVLKHVLKVDAGLELHVSKTSVLPTDVTHSQSPGPPGTFREHVPINEGWSD